MINRQRGGHVGERGREPFGIRFGQQNRDQRRRIDNYVNATPVSS